MKKLYTLITLALALCFGNANAQSFFEDFEDVSSGVAGWDSVNVSNPIGTTNWLTGNLTVFAPWNGVGFLAANFNGCAGTGTISEWMASPDRMMQNGDKIIFSTTCPPASTWPDRLQVYLSQAGTASTFPTDEVSLGTYTMLLLDINDTYTAGGYPESWQSYTITIAGLPVGQTSCRFAFRYFVEQGGPTGANSNYIGIDSVAYVSTFSNVNEIDISSSVNLFPNPANDQVTVEINSDGNFTEQLITICDLLGNVVYQEMVATRVTVINVAELSAGIYTITTRNESGIGTKKLVIQ